jgi:hypothetical protein
VKVQMYVLESKIEINYMSVDIVVNEVLSSLKCERLIRVRMSDNPPGMDIYD